MKILITGGAGFIGCNLAARLIKDGHVVTVFDNLSRKGSECNLEWLREHGQFKLEHGDVTAADDVKRVFDAGPFDGIIHLAAQVAVTTSVLDPMHDFRTNVIGTVNMLEALRLRSPGALFTLASTNKVYGSLHDVPVNSNDRRYFFADRPLGINEQTNLDFHSPYGCSKGSADQYVIDYGRIYNLKTVVLRKSCIYGLRQFGVEDQGWLAWFLIAHELGRPITLYGNGKQVRDVLFIDDLADLYVRLLTGYKPDAPHFFNVGGGPDNTLSLIESMELIERVTGRKLTYTLGDWRAGDQPIYVSDIRRVEQAYGWKPKVNPSVGLERLARWVHDNRQLFA